MTKKEKRLRRMRQNPKNVRYDDLISVLLDYDFEVREGKGSHVFVQCQIGDNVWLETITRPHGNKKTVNQQGVKRLLKMLDEIIDVLAEIEAEEDIEDNGN